MKLKLAFGFLPYILIEEDLDPNTKIGRTVGSSKYFFIWLDDSPMPTTDEHEELHVAWWYLTTVVGALALMGANVLADYALLSQWWVAFLSTPHIDPILGTVLKRYKVLKESFAYAYEASHRKDPQRYINSIVNSEYHKKRYGDDFGRKVQKRYNRWFS